ncbi:MAG: class I SAM-dependent methyltransferase [Oligoflexales bacterium]|nr:class I SAM-dependent methyltransferase [Oligoflexales bacterium]
MKKPKPYYDQVRQKWEDEYPSPGELGEVWDFYKECGYHTPVASFTRVLEKVNWERGRILDFGCDNGLLLNFICNELKGVQGFGIDINPRSINEACKKVVNCQFKLFDGLKIPFEDNYFDLIFTSAVIKHIRYEDRERIYNEFRRVSKFLFVIEVDSHKQETKTEQGWTFYLSDFRKEFEANFEPLDVRSECGDLWGLYKL